MYSAVLAPFNAHASLLSPSFTASSLFAPPPSKAVKNPAVERKEKAEKKAAAAKKKAERDGPTAVHEGGGEEGEVDLEKIRAALQELEDEAGESGTLHREGGGSRRTRDRGWSILWYPHISPFPLPH